MTDIELNAAARDVLAEREHHSDGFTYARHTPIEQYVAEAFDDLLRRPRYRRGAFDLSDDDIRAIRAGTREPK